MPSNSEALLPLIPYLRRHARLLTGSKDIGDAYVRLCLELVVAEPARIDGGDLRTQLYKAFYASWGAINSATKKDMGEAISGLERLEQGLAMLPPMDRQVLVLMAVDEFSLDQVGQILELDAAAVRKHLATARGKLQQALSVPVLIIEDETMIAMELSEIVKDMGLTVMGVVARQEDAINAAYVESPGLVLADIQLEDDGSGLVAAQAILQQYHLPIVFVTGYPERLLTGDGLEPAFVVAKPFQPDGLKATIAQALSTYEDPARATEHRTKLLAKIRKITLRELQAEAHP